MSYLIHICQAPVGVARALGSRVWFGLPGVAGALTAYSYFPTPTQLGQSQNLAGTAPFACVCVHNMSASRVWTHLLALLFVRAQTSW